MIQGGETQYASVDHLNTPYLLTDSHQSVVWQGFADPFGVPVRIAGPASLTQRFPGQRADAETGLNQNYLRILHILVERINRLDAEQEQGIETGEPDDIYEALSELALLNRHPVLIHEVDIGRMWYWHR